MNSLDIASNFPYNLLVVCLARVFPCVGQSLAHTQCVLITREVSSHFKKLIDETLFPSVTLFTCHIQMRLSNCRSTFQRVELINRHVLPLFTGLKKVSLSNSAIMNEGLQKLTSIEELELRGDYRITDKTVEKLVNLRSLNLMNCEGVSGECLAHLPELKRLVLRGNTKIPGDCLLPLSRLEELDLTCNTTIGDTHLVNMLHSLRILRLDENSHNITGASITRMTRLEELNGHSSRIDDNVIAALVSLKKLQFSHKSRITCRGLATLTGLTSLDLGGNHNNITTRGFIPFLHCLRHVNLRNNRNIDQAVLFHCPVLEGVIVGCAIASSDIMNGLLAKGVHVQLQ